MSSWRYKDKACENRILAGRGLEPQRGVCGVDGGREMIRIHRVIRHGRKQALGEFRR